MSVIPAPQICPRSSELVVVGTRPGPAKTRCVLRWEATFFRIFCGKSMVNPMNYRDFLWISGFNFQKTHWLRSSKTLIHVMVIECNWRNRYDTDTIISIHSRLSQSILGIPTDQPVWRDHGRLWTVLNWSFLKASVGQETKKKELVDEWKWTSPI